MDVVEIGVHIRLVWCRDVVLGFLVGDELGFLLLTRGGWRRGTLVLGLVLIRVHRPMEIVAFLTVIVVNWLIGVLELLFRRVEVIVFLRVLRKVTDFAIIDIVSIHGAALALILIHFLDLIHKRHVHHFALIVVLVIVLTFLLVLIVWRRRLL